MNQLPWRRRAVCLVPVVFLLVAFGRLVAHPTHLLVDADHPTVDQARVVDAAPGNDLTRQFWPLQLHVSRTLARTGHVPRWDDRGFGGRPLVGNPQAGLFYPPGWAAWVIPAPATLGWITLGHLVWAGAGMIRLGRTLGLSLTGRTISGGCFILSPYVLAQTFEGHYPHVWAVAWYPWAFEAMIGLGRGRWRSGLLLATSLAAVLLVGHPQEGYYLAVALGFWAGTDLVRLVMVRATRSRLAPTVAVWLGVAGLTLGLAAVELIPDALAQGWGLRSSRLPLRLASRYHPLALNAVQLLNPFALGGPSAYFGPENYWETVTSVGLVPLLLAGVGVGWTRDRPRVRGWMILVLAATTFALGRKLGLFALMYDWVPGMDRFRVPSRALFLANLGAAILAGFGVDALAAEPVGSSRRDRLLRRWLVASCFLAGFLGWGVRRADQAGPSLSVVNPAPSHQVRSPLRSLEDADRLALACRGIVRQPLFWLAVVGVSASLVGLRFRPEWRRQVAVGLGLLGLVELAGHGHQLLVTSPPSAFLDQRLTLAIRREIPERAQAVPARIRADPVALSDLQAVDLGLSKTDINDTFQIQHAADLYQTLYDLSRPRPIDPAMPMDEPVADRVQQTQQAVLDRMGVALALVPPTCPRLDKLVAANGWTIAASVPAADRRSVPVQLARNPAALPLAYVVGRAEVEADDRMVVDRLARVDPRRAVLMSHDPLDRAPRDEPRQQFRPVEWASLDPDRVVLRVATTGPGLLVVASTWMPGWTARVDGTIATVERGNHAQQVIALPEAGSHEVVLTYTAPGLAIGAKITLASVIVLLLLGVLGRRRNRPIT